MPRGDGNWIPRTNSQRDWYLVTGEINYSYTTVTVLYCIGVCSCHGIFHLGIPFKKFSYIKVMHICIME